MQTEHITYIPDFLTQEESNELFTHLKNDISWTSLVIAPNGDKVKLNREVAYIADRQKEYFYANLKFETPNGVWTPPLLALKDRLNQQYDQKFNSVLLNKYADGREEIKWHTDKEFCLGEKPVIACVNLDETMEL